MEPIAAKAPIAVARSMLAACVHRARKRVSWYRSAAWLDGAAIAIPYRVLSVAARPYKYGGIAGRGTKRSDQSLTGLMIIVDNN